MTEGAAESTIRVAPSRRRAEEWMLVLLAADIACRIERDDDGGWALRVTSLDTRVATDALAAYDEDLAEGEPPPEHGATTAGLVMAAVLVAVYALTGPRAGGHRAFEAGSAVADLIMAREPWRAVTALTLHADLTHLAGNVLFGAILATGVCRALGPGLGAALIVLAGATGNLGAAYLYRTAHSAVGASTAVFGAVGILSGLSALRRRRWRGARRKAWVPLAAGAALLALVGTSPRADLAAHLLGFVAGLPLGAATAFTPPPGRGAQWALAVGTAAVVGGAWALALG